MGSANDTKLPLDLRPSATSLERIPSATFSDKTSSVMKLPPELLYIIFDMADPRPAYSNWKKYIAHLEAEQDDRGAHDPPVREPPPPPTHFPHCLARVCWRWNEVLAGSPGRWTNLVVFLDDNLEETLADLEMSLRLSQDLPLDVVVDYAMKTEDMGIDAYCDEEPTRSRAVIEALRPHFHRCRSITFETMLGISLPSPSRDLSRVSSTLRNLTLKCKYDSEHPTGVLFGADPVLVSSPTSRRLTDLFDLYLCGYTVIDACRNAPHLIQAAQGKLTLRNFQARNGETAEDMVPYFLEVLSFSQVQREEIVLYDIDLPLWEPKVTLFAQAFSIRDFTTLTDLSYNTMRNILQFANFRDAWDLTIKRCPLPEASAGLGPAPGVGRLAPVHNKWRRAGRCAPHARERRRQGDCYVDELELKYCHMFSADAMKKLCRSRTPGGAKRTSKMYNIQVTGFGPVITKEERQWFKKKYPDMITWTKEMMDKRGNSYYADRDAPVDPREAIMGPRVDIDMRAYLSLKDLQLTTHRENCFPPEAQVEFVRKYLLRVQNDVQQLLQLQVAIASELLLVYKAPLDTRKTYIIRSQVILYPLNEADMEFVASRDLSLEQVAEIPVHGRLRLLNLVVKVSEHHEQTLDSRLSQVWSDHRKRQDGLGYSASGSVLVQFFYKGHFVSASTVGIRPEEFHAAAELHVQPSPDKTRSLDSLNPLLTNESPHEDQDIDLEVGMSVRTGR
ncbi:hypothetical protein NLJ89_g765 [Agrocybe chaxingu]|uniref:F-box domain-containing protein n=1 Tax=Agrocybe chaxingu TaxID=84603 RepID=A0A9W8N1A6_9AGAR|nr:hypothetical protein NLJ89_g765 [Agrocybe chaxingu]